jgi:hypothetical protein
MALLLLAFYQSPFLFNNSLASPGDRGHHPMATIQLAKRPPASGGFGSAPLTSPSWDGGVALLPLVFYQSSFLFNNSLASPADGAYRPARQEATPLGFRQGNEGR